MEVTMNWENRKYLNSVADGISKAVHAHGEFVENARKKGFDLNKCSASERSHFIKEFDRHTELAHTGDSCALLSEWCKRADTSKSVTAPVVAFGLARELKSAIERLEFSGSLRVEAENLLIFLTQIIDHLSAKHAGEICDSLSQSAAHGIARKPAKATETIGSILSDEKQTAQKSVSKMSPTDVVNEMIRRSDQRTALLGSKTLKSVVAWFDQEASSRGLLEGRRKGL